MFTKFCANFMILFEKHADVADFGKGIERGSITFKVKDSRTKSGLVSIFTLTNMELFGSELRIYVEVPPP